MRRVHEGHFTVDDGAALRYRHWPAAGDSDRALILLRRDEDSGRWQEGVEALGLPDFHLFALEARAHAASFMTYVRDAERFARHIETQHAIARENMAVLGCGEGGVIAAAWVHDYAPPLRALVLANLALRERLSRPFGRRPLGREAVRRIVADAAAITVPTQLLVAGADRAAERKAQHRFYARLGAARKERHAAPGLGGDRLAARSDDAAWAAMRRFISEVFAAPPARAELGAADRAGPFKEEFARRAAALPWYAPKRWHYAAYGLAMRTVGRLSDGIRTGLAFGFDSGPMLDYVYRDEACGLTPLGRRIDRDFLDRAGWAAIRQRRRHLETMLGRAIAAVRGAGLPLSIADIGAGGGRYTLEAVKTHAPDASVLLLDHDARSVEAGRALGAALDMQQVRCAEGDGFDRAALARLSPAPTIALASGLYEQVSDNAPVRESLAGLAAAVPAGGCLLYTNQPWNPELDFIARMLTTRHGRPWVMRRRSQAEIDQLAGEAGFEKVAMAIDDNGIMTVSLARRRP